MQHLADLEATLGHTFTNQDLLRQALVHRSFLNENPGFPLGHNERLEFLGDAVLELVVTRYLYLTYPNPEGELTNWRASLVNANMLAKVAARLDLGDHLHLSRGEAADADSKARHYILANTFESVVGALYLDAGYEACERFIHRVLLPELPYILQHRLYQDPKSQFQEIAQEKLSITPTYRVLAEAGPDHARQFEVGVYLDEELVARGLGSSKREAQERAAQAGLTAKGWT